jgi:hypothetical protein
MSQTEQMEEAVARTITLTLTGLELNALLSWAAVTENEARLDRDDLALLKRIRTEKQDIECAEYLVAWLVSLEREKKL